VLIKLHVTVTVTEEIFSNHPSLQIDDSASSLSDERKIGSPKKKLHETGRPGDSRSTRPTSKARKASDGAPRKPWSVPFKADSTESPKASQLVHSLNLSARKAARGAMAKPWYQNSKPASVKAATAAKVAKALPIEVEGLAVELGHLVKPAHQEHRPRGKEPSMGQSPSLDILQHLHPDRVNESLVLLEQVLESLQLIGQVCCCSFTGTFPIPPKVLSTRTCLNLP
jgi:hypothetical protein